jgi:uncharacterized membrane protein YphA (DoxX/SURF4 family)
MFLATIVVSVLLAVALAASASFKLRKDPRLVEGLGAVGVPVARFWQLAVLELAGAAGLVIGLFWWPLGVAAAIGVILYFVGATGAHVRFRDWGHIASPVGILVVAVAALVLRSLSAG